MVLVWPSETQEACTEHVLKAGPPVPRINTSGGFTACVSEKREKHKKDPSSPASALVVHKVSPALIERENQGTFRLLKQGL